VIASLEALKPRVEQAVKLGALPVILGGDCSIALAVVAGARRYFRNVGLLYMDRDADLNTPATTPSGCLDGMVVSHLTGRGAAELVRFWGEPPLVREPDLALFGVARLDPPEEEVLSRSPLRRYLAVDVLRMGPAAAAQLAVERIHGTSSEFVLHFDVDVIADFQATNYPGSSGLSLEDVRAALEVFARQKHLAAIEVTAYNPGKDPDGSGAKLILDLLAGILEVRLAALQGSEAPSQSGTESAAQISPAPAEPTVAAPAALGEAGSSDSLAESQVDDGPAVIEKADESSS
jgi:arginase